MQNVSREALAEARGGVHAQWSTTRGDSAVRECCGLCKRNKKCEVTGSLPDKHWHFWCDHCFLWCLAESLTSTSYMPATPPLSHENQKRLQTFFPPYIPWREKLPLFENHCPKSTTKKESITNKPEWKWNGIRNSSKEGRKQREKGTKNRWDEQKMTVKRMDLNPIILIITLNLGGLNTLIKI